MTTFHERKAARKLNPGPKFAKYKVVAQHPFSGEVVGIFPTKKGAEEFAFMQRGALVGNTDAQNVLMGRYAYKKPVPSAMTFAVYGVSE